MLSTRLNNSLPIKDVLRECGTAINTLPGFCRCPVCNHPTLYATRAGDEAGGWYQCQGACGFTGDSVALLAARERSTVEDYLRRQRLRDAAVYTADNIGRHVDETRRRKMIADGWRDISGLANMLVGAPPEVAAVLAAYRMTPHLDAARWTAGLGRRFGACSNGRARLKLGGGATGPFPGTKNKAWLVTPVYAAPGLVTGFAACDDNATDAVYHYANNADNDGLVFLDRPRPAGEDAVYAFGSLRHAVALHVMAHAGCDREPPPIVVYTPTTTTAWRHVRGRKVIFWAPTIDLDLFAQARLLGDRAHVAHVPPPPGETNPFACYRGETCNMALRRLDAAARPWLWALKDYLVACARSAAVDQAPVRLGLSPDELEKLRCYCATAEEGRIVNAVYDAGHVDVAVTLADGARIVQKDDGWYRIAAGGNHILVTDAVPVFDYVTHTGGEELLTGHVRVGGKSDRELVPFRAVPRANIRRDWLAALCAKAGRVIRAADTFRYCEAAYAFHRPALLPGLEQIGYDAETGAFIFPAGAITPGGAIDDAPRLAPTPHPSDRFNAAAAPPTGETVKTWFTDDDGAGFWRVYLAGLYNILAPAAGREPAAFGVYNPTGPDVVAEAARALYGEVLNRAAPTEIRAAADRHHLPVWIDAAAGPATAAELLKTGGLTNIVVDLGSEENAHLAKLLGWHVITCADPADIPEDANALLGSLLMEFQRDEGNRDLPPLRLALETLRAWLRRTYEYPAPGLRGILQQTAAPDPTPAGEGVRLLGLLKLLLDAGELEIRRQPEPVAPLPPAKTFATASGDNVYIPVEAAAKALRRARLPYEITIDSTNALAAAGALTGTVTSLGSVIGWKIRASAL